ncbi:hypothetical protein VNO77_09408 [Canavalia gladiata]|uniref:Uncharacterized protein n=1 Tax=Canavalia gladiata TaxID=3824 RepID=A0AAN9QU71_CANGL
MLLNPIRSLMFMDLDGLIGEPNYAANLYDEDSLWANMLERSSNNYDYLLDEGTECNTTSDLLLERNHELSIVDLLVPSLYVESGHLEKLVGQLAPHLDKIAEIIQHYAISALMVWRLLDFLVSLSEHPLGKGLLLREGIEIGYWKSLMGK